MAPRASLFGYVLTFAAGFGFGFIYHHIASMAHSALDSDIGSSGERMQTLEARLRAVEDKLALQKLVEHSEQTMAQQQVAQVVTPQPTVSTVSKILGGTKSRRKLKAQKAAAAKKEVADDDSEEEDATRAAAGAAAKLAGAKQMTAMDEDGGNEPTDLTPSGRLHCPTGRKPYHLVLTAQDNRYQAWQTRIMYYHFRKLQKADPCTEMTGFTRLLSSTTPEVPDALMSEMPTVAVKQLDAGSDCKDSGENTCDMGFPVMNRPHAVTQFLERLPPSLTEQYVLIAETDHVFLRCGVLTPHPAQPLPNPTQPNSIQGAKEQSDHTEASLLPLRVHECKGRADRCPTIPNPNSQHIAPLCRLE